MHRRAAAAVALTVVVVIAAVLAVTLHSSPAQSRVTTAPVVQTTVPPPGQTPTTSSWAIPAGSTLLASFSASIASYAVPASTPTSSVGATFDGAPLTVPVVATSGNFVRIRLPGRPNGSTAWVRADEVRLSYTPYRIVIDEAETSLSLYDDNHLVDTFPAGIGTSTDPTPTGQYFVAYFARPASPGYGPFVIATSAHSDAIADWDGSGDAEIAIHGPLGADAAIGTRGARISHGCIRLHDADLELLRTVPVGTPIDIID